MSDLSKFEPKNVSLAFKKEGLKSGSNILHFRARASIEQQKRELALQAIREKAEKFYW